MDQRLSQQVKLVMELFIAIIKVLIATGVDIVASAIYY
jgi:hypothetical protein